ncbi:hypothetical protein F8S09_13605 [Deinococcus sp. SDU3-2]|uniref:Uncharacterized protein n=1 Tax=Deinococcus terrestris TaxID=2651870 RepID=A0A7X1TSD7_9DEIO|nr:hypothetical protein [Deinococcus terrestris]MPY67705.1 hypothetical protein [Deinococcus terrestris]
MTKPPKTLYTAEVDCAFGDFPLFETPEEAIASAEGHRVTGVVELTHLSVGDRMLNDVLSSQLLVRSASDFALSDDDGLEPDGLSEKLEALLTETVNFFGEEEDIPSAAFGELQDALVAAADAWAEKYGLVSKRYVSVCSHDFGFEDEDDE